MLMLGTVVAYNIFCMYKSPVYSTVSDKRTDQNKPVDHTSSKQGLVRYYMFGEYASHLISVVDCLL